MRNDAKNDMCSYSRQISHPRIQFGSLWAHMFQPNNNNWYSMIQYSGYGTSRSHCSQNADHTEKRLVTLSRAELSWLMLSSLDYFGFNFTRSLFLNFNAGMAFKRIQKKQKKLVVVVLSFCGAIFLVQPRKLWLDLPKSANLNCWFSVSIGKQ